MREEESGTSSSIRPVGPAWHGKRDRRREALLGVGYTFRSTTSSGSCAPISSSPRGPDRARRGTDAPDRPDDLGRLLALVNREADGSYGPSRAKPFRAVMWAHTLRGYRKDDPNDLVPHEHHRELRGALVFSAWLNRVDVKRDQSVITVVTEGGTRLFGTTCSIGRPVSEAPGCGPGSAGKGTRSWSSGPW